MKTTVITPAGRLVIQPSATRASVQYAWFPSDRTAAPCGFLIPNASAGIVSQATEAVATINEESTPPELSAVVNVAGTTVPTLSAGLSELSGLDAAARMADANDGGDAQHGFFSALARLA